jgi:hypothetical protein
MRHGRGCHINHAETRHAPMMVCLHAGAHRAVMLAFSRDDSISGACATPPMPRYGGPSADCSLDWQGRHLGAGGPCAGGASPNSGASQVHGEDTAPRDA